MEGPRITYAFDGFRLDTLSHELRREGVAIALEPKAFDLLAELLAHAGALRSRDELLDAVWGHRHVTPGVLNRSIALLRRALGDDADHPRYIQTVHALGYRFIAPVATPPAEGGRAPAGVPDIAATATNPPPDETTDRSEVMKQTVRYVAATDQVNLAWTEIGHGVPLVKAATWLTHLQYDLESPIWAHWIRFFGKRFRYIRYDERGCGMSDWRIGDLALSQWVDDLESVVEVAGIDRPFALLGISQGAATAIMYTLRHPQRVSHLILYGGYAVGANGDDTDPDRVEMYKAVQDVVHLGWGSNNPAFRQVFTSRFAPLGSRAQLDWFNELCTRTTSVENASALLAARGNIDVREYLPLVRTPTLVLHSSHDQVAPLSQGKLLAGRIPGATFVQLDSHNHVLLEQEPAWAEFQHAVLEFTGQQATPL